MHIILARHGRPDIDLEEIGKNWVTAAEFGQVVEAYENSDLRADEKPPSDLVSAASKCSVFLNSSLLRSKSSCAALGVGKVAEEDAVFDEASMPYTQWGGLRLPISAWSVMFRIGWVFGFHQNAHRVRDIAERSRLATKVLIDQAEEHGDVLLMGHGILNRMIANQLGKEHWRMTSTDGDGYWSYTIFEDPVSAQAHGPLRM